MFLSLLIMGKKGRSSHLHCQAKTPSFPLQGKVSSQPKFSSYRKVLSQPQQVDIPILPEVCCAFGVGKELVSEVCNPLNPVVFLKAEIGSFL